MMKKAITILLLLCCHSLAAQYKGKFAQHGKEKYTYQGVEFTASGNQMTLQYIKKGKLKDPIECRADEYHTFRGMPLYVSEDKSVAYAISPDKKALFDFDMRSNYNVIRDITVWSDDNAYSQSETQKIKPCIGLFIDAQATSAFHASNMNRVVFMSKDLSLEAIDPSAMLNTFTLGKQHVFVRSFTDTSLANRILRYVANKENQNKPSGFARGVGTAINILAGSSSDTPDFVLNERKPNYGLFYVIYLNGKAVDTLASQVNEDKELPIFQNWTSWRENNLLSFDFFKQLNARKLLPPGAHTLKIEAYAQFQDKIYSNDTKPTEFFAKVAEGDVKMTVTASSFYDLTVLNSAAYTNIFKNLMSNEMQDPKFIADVTKKFQARFNKGGTKYDLKKVVSPQDGLDVIKNEFGRPLRKESWVYVYAKDRATNLCNAFIFVYAYDFDGVDYDKVGDFWYQGDVITHRVGDERLRVSYGSPFIIDCGVIK